MHKKFNLVVSTLNLWLFKVGSVWAASGSTDDPLNAADDFSKKVLDIVQGPVLKMLAAVVLLVGIAGLLRGRYKLALSCAMAFLLILFLPILLGKV